MSGNLVLSVASGAALAFALVAALAFALVPKAVSDG